MTLVHWDDVEALDIPGSVRPLDGRRQCLAEAAGSVDVGMERVVLRPGQRVAPPRPLSPGEEILHVLAGSAALRQDGATCTVAAGDTIVRAAGAADTLAAGDDGVEALIFGRRRTGAEQPWDAEPAAGATDGGPGPRPANVVALGDVEGDYGGMSKRLAAAGGATRSGLNRIALPPNEEGAPPHCHTAEEEVFVVLDGGGTLELWSAPKAGEMPRSEPAETHSLRRGHVVSRPAGTRVSHCFRAGGEGLTYLAYGTRDPRDVAYYPRSNKIFFRGIGLIARLEPLDYFDGEPS